MKGLWLENKTLCLREDLPRPELLPDEALIQVSLAGICSTDLELTRGYMTFEGVLGHEFVGKVVEAPTDTEWVGRRVVGEINAACGRCAFCLAGRPGHCPSRTVLGIAGRNGAFSQYLALPLVNLHRVPDSVGDEAAVFCEPLAAALQILEQVPVHPSSRVLVLGAGRLGQLIAQVLELCGCQLEVVARHARQRALLRQCAIAAMEEQEIPRRVYDIVVEATGSPDGFSLALGAVRPRGTIVLKSTYHLKADIDIASLVVDEITLVGSRCGPFAPALRLMERGQVDTAPLIEARYPLSLGLEAFEHATRPGALKVLLQCQKG